ncbi:hypothetical protein OC842_005557 [Tilletia horrida]|uniref:Uncharacterized protein n=1 Tax=Tilletia horrida TaxID=155126 RepID=A0AAN6G9M0_9BASI|nr:hypothetical protein OC842_005557 [Tilletia horrida]
MSGTMNDTMPEALGVPLGGIPGPGRSVKPNIVYLALYNILLLGLLARFFAGSTTLAYTWRPGLFAFLRIFVFSLRIWLSVHGMRDDDTAARHMFIAEALLLAAAPMILLSASLMLVRNAARAYRPSSAARRAMGQKQRANVLRIITYVLDFGLLCMGILYCEAAVGYTDAIQGSADDIRRLRNIWRATSVYEVVIVLAAVMMIMTLVIQYCRGALNLERVPHPELESRKLIQLTALNVLLFIVTMYRAAQVDHKAPGNLINKDVPFFGVFCFAEFLAASFFVVFNYERLMPRSSRSSRSSGSSGSGGPGSPRTGRANDPEKGHASRDARNPRGPTSDLRILALTQNASAQRGYDGNQSSDSDGSQQKKKIGRIERASSIFHERIRRASQAEGSSDDDYSPPPALITDPREMKKYQNADPNLRYKLLSEIQRQQDEDRPRVDQGEVFARMPAPAQRDGPDPRQRMQRAIEVRGQHERRHGSDSERSQHGRHHPHPPHSKQQHKRRADADDEAEQHVSTTTRGPPATANPYSSANANAAANAKRQGTRNSWNEADQGPRVSNVPVAPARVIVNEYAPRQAHGADQQQVSPRSMIASVHTSGDETGGNVCSVDPSIPISPKTTTLAAWKDKENKPMPSPSVGALFRMWCKGAPALAAEHENSNAQNGPASPRSPRDTRTKAASPASVVLGTADEDGQDYFSAVSLATPTMMQQQRGAAGVPGRPEAAAMAPTASGELIRSASSRSAASSATKVSTRAYHRDTLADEYPHKSSSSNNKQGGGGGGAMPPPSADMSSLHSFHLGEFTPTPRVLKAERPRQMHQHYQQQQRSNTYQ